MWLSQDIKILFGFSTPRSEVERIIRSYFQRFTLVYFGILIVSVCIFVFVNRSYKRTMALSISSAVHNFLAVGDLRRTVGVLNPNLSIMFSAIAFLDKDGSRLVVLPNNTAYANAENSMFHLREEISIYSSDDRLPETKIGTLLFYSDQTQPAKFALVIWMSLAAIAMLFYRRFYAAIENQQRLVVSRREFEVFSNLAHQVSHDIRSPLSALNMFLGTLHGLPEEKRLLIRGATQRINDIANGLLQKAKPAATSSTISDEPRILVPLIDSIVSEKRTQFRDRMEIEIVGEFNGGYSLFSKISGSELARVISNLINNSVEAFTGPGKIVVAIAEKDELIKISIKDNGKGIPPHVLSRLGERGVTHGKEGTQSGSGLGVHHARETIESAGGKFLIESTVGVGTTITLALPKCEPPSWFRESLTIKLNSVVVSVDDDQTIHQIWAGRLASAGFDRSLNHKKFSSLDVFGDWVQADKPSNTIYLVDYEFLGQGGNGLDAIRRLGIEKHAVLITSRFEEAHVRRTAESLGVKIIPKSLAPFVPIKIKRPREKYHAVLIDDDPLVAMTWKIAAQENGKNFICFSNEETFFDSCESIDPSSPLFVDVSLANGVRGEDVAAKASRAGFTSIRLATGYDAASVSLPVGVIEIVGKDPLFP